MNASPRPPWLLVFDLDGTLINSSLDLCLAVNAALSHVGAPVLPHERIAGFIGEGAATLLRRALSASLLQQPEPLNTLPSAADDRLDTALSFFLAFYRRHKLDHTHLYPGVLDSLTRLHRHAPERPMAVLTNKPVRPSVEICRGLGIADFFFAIYGGDSLLTKKPDPEGLLQLITEARRRATSWEGQATAPIAGVTLIGDSPVDVQTARNAGTQVLGCRYGLAPETLAAAHPDQMCDHPGQWPLLLDGSE